MLIAGRVMRKVCLIIALLVLLTCVHIWLQPSLVKLIHARWSNPCFNGSQCSSHHSDIFKVKDRPFVVKHVAKGTDDVNLTEYKNILTQYAINNVIILALLDSAFLDMTLNFYETSLLPYGITNFLFIASDVKACEQLYNRSIQCYVYMADPQATKATVYGSKDFKRKMNIRTYMILDALELGFTVLHTDVDIYYFQNPLEHIQCSGTCDIAILWDSGAHNAGFLYVRPTHGSIALYKQMETFAKTTSMADQSALNGAIGKVRKTTKLTVISLSKKAFLSGKSYWQTGKRSFAPEQACSGCVVAHNNWIVTREAKTYRFKELHLWVYDGDQYYSSDTRKYLAYSNPAIFKDKAETTKNEVQCLTAAFAIGEILNRTVILPRLHCNLDLTKWNHGCPLNNHLKLVNLERNFPYRENTFLTHPKTSTKVKNSQSKLHLINTQKANTTLKGVIPENVHQLHPKDTTLGATSDEIKAWFDKDNSSVLLFHSLYDAFKGYSDTLKEDNFKKKIKDGIKKGSYMQF